MPVVTGATGIVTKGFKEKFGSHSMKTIQYIHYKTQLY
jgi:hypothetical protein